MADEYSEFRKAVCSSSHYLQRLRQLIVNSVIATDIIDKDLQKGRNSRREKPFCDVSSLRIESQDNATLIIEHLIQADRKWNERLFREIHESYVTRSGARDS
jgi:hypothetical protein